MGRNPPRLKLGGLQFELQNQRSSTEDPTIPATEPPILHHPMTRTSPYIFCCYLCAIRLTGALISAILSYEVRLRAKAREYAEERKRIAHGAFSSLTDVVGGGLFVKLYVDE